MSSPSDLNPHGLRWDTSSSPPQAAATQGGDYGSRPKRKTFFGKSKAKSPPREIPSNSFLSGSEALGRKKPAVARKNSAAGRDNIARDPRMEHGIKASSPPVIRRGRRNSTLEQMQMNSAVNREEMARDPRLEFAQMEEQQVMNNRAYLGIVAERDNADEAEVAKHYKPRSSLSPPPPNAARKKSPARTKTHAQAPRSKLSPPNAAQNNSPRRTKTHAQAPRSNLVPPNAAQNNSPQRTNQAHAQKNKHVRKVKLRKSLFTKYKIEDNPLEEEDEEEPEVGRTSLVKDPRMERESFRRKSEGDNNRSRNSAIRAARCSDEDTLGSGSCGSRESCSGASRRNTVASIDTSIREEIEEDDEQKQKQECRQSRRESLSANRSSSSNQSMRGEDMDDSAPLTRPSEPARRRRPKRTAVFDVGNARRSLLDRLGEDESTQQVTQSITRGDSNSSPAVATERKMNFRSSLRVCLREMGFDQNDISRAIANTDANSTGDAAKVVEWLGDHQEIKKEDEEDDDDRSVQSCEVTEYTKQSCASNDTNETDESDENVKLFSTSLKGLGFTRKEIRKSKNMYRRHSKTIEAGDFISAMLEAEEEPEGTNRSTSDSASSSASRNRSGGGAGDEAELDEIIRQISEMGFEALHIKNAMKGIKGKVEVDEVLQVLQTEGDAPALNRPTTALASSSTSRIQPGGRAEDDDAESNEIVRQISEMGFKDTQIKNAMKGMKGKVDVDKVLGLLLSGTGLCEPGLNNNALNNNTAIDLVSSRHLPNYNNNSSRTMAEETAQEKRLEQQTGQNLRATVGSSRATLDESVNPNIRGHNPLQQEGEAQEKTLSIEITPGQFAKLLKGRATWNAMHDGTDVKAPCILCNVPLQCCPEADYVLCPDCNIVSPLHTDDSGDWRRSRTSASAGGHVGAVGLGYRRR